MRSRAVAAAAAHIIIGERTETMRNLLEPEEHRKLAAAFFNETWRLLNLTNRSAEQDAQMIHSAHASRMH